MFSYMSIIATESMVTIWMNILKVTISGLNPNESVLLLSSDGKVIGTGKAINGTTTLSAKANGIVFIKIDQDSIKVLVR